MDITKRLFLKSALTVGAAAMPLAQAKAFMPDRRDGDGAKRYGMLIDLRKCIGCQACTVSCSVEATFQRKDGIVVISNEQCIGCGYCVQACPYDARFINEETKTADKCTFCSHRLEAGLLPACVESCVGGARVIGDLNDPKSQISQLYQQHKDELKVLKPESGTVPHVFYLGLDEAFVSKVDGQPMLWTGEA